MNTREGLPFQVICTVYDEFGKQSKGRLVIGKAIEFDGAIFASLSLTELEVFASSWIKELRESPEFYFYRGNFFWHVFIEKELLCAELIEKQTKGNSPIGKILKWPASIVDAQRVVKNLLDIMKGHERAFQSNKKQKERQVVGVR